MTIGYASISWVGMVICIISVLTDSIPAAVGGVGWIIYGVLLDIAEAIEKKK